MICQKCGNEHDGSFGSGKFCSRKCANTRIITLNTKRLISDKVKKSEKFKLYLEKRPKGNQLYSYICDKCKKEFQSYKIGNARKIHCVNCRRRTPPKNVDNIRSILELSKRTVGKIIKRLNIGCSRCGWKEGHGHMHHIKGRKIIDSDSHNNISYLCPNCHTLVHEKKIKSDTLLNLYDQLGDSWKKVYNI